MKPECICLTGDPTQCPCRTEAEIRSDENHKRFEVFWTSLKDKLKDLKADEMPPTPFLDILMKEKENDIQLPPTKERDS